MTTASMAKVAAWLVLGVLLVTAFADEVSTQYAGLVCKRSLAVLAGLSTHLQVPC